MVSPPYCRWCCSGELELCILTELQTVTHAKVGALRRPPYPETPAPWWRKQPPDDPSDKTSYHGPRLVRPPRVLRRVDAVNPEFEVQRFLKVLARREHWFKGGGAPAVNPIQSNFVGFGRAAWPVAAQGCKQTGAKAALGRSQETFGIFRRKMCLFYVSFFLFRG